MEKYLGTFEGKMNMDVNYAVMPAEDYSYALNFSNNDKEVSNLGGGGRVRSSTTIENIYAVAGDLVIGRATYPKGNGEIVFVKGVLPVDNKILYVAYNDSVFKSAQVKLLLQATWLNFSNRIDAKCIDDNVVFTDDSNEPRIIDIVKMLNYNEQTENSNGVLYLFEEINGREYEAVSGILIKHFVYNDKVYRFRLPDGATFIIVPPPDSHYTEIQDYNDNTYHEIGEEDILLIAKPPTKPAVLTYTYESEIKTNNIYGNLFAVTYRYIYLDGRKSVFSPYGVLQLPVGQTTEDGSMKTTAFNGISIQVFNEANRNLKGIDIAVKNLDNGSFSLVKTLRRDEVNINNGAIVQFYNNRAFFTLDVADTLRDHDFIPYKAENLEILPDSRLIVGDLKEGYEPIKTNVVLSLETETTDISVVSSTIVETTDTYSGVPCHIYEVQNANGYQVGMKVDINFTYKVDGTSFSDSVNLVTGEGTGSTNDEKFTHLLRYVSNQIREKMLYNIKWEGSGIDSDLRAYVSSFQIKDSDMAKALFYGDVDRPMYASASMDCYSTQPKLYNSFVIADTLSIVGYRKHHKDPPYYPVGKIIDLSITSISFSEVENREFKTIKSNSITDIGIKYFDENMRPFPVMPLGSVKAGYLDLGTINSTHLDIKHTHIKATVNNLPPSNAKYYTFAATKNPSYIDYLQIPVYEYDDIDGYGTCKVENVGIYWKEDNDNVIIPIWTFEKGDRIRKLADGSASATPYNDFTYLDGVDTEILKEKSHTVSTDTFLLTYFNADLDVATGDLIEIYRPRKKLESDKSEIYYEIGDIHEIKLGLHEGNTQNQTTSQPAIIDINFGNATLKRRVTANHVSTTNVYAYYIEDRNLCDYYKSEYNGYGRASVITDIDTDKFTMLRFGGKLFPEAANNFIAKFDWDDYAVLSKQHGSINGIRVVGETLVVFQDTKLTSFYMNKTSLQEADGGTQTVLIDKVLNNKAVSEFDFGCINPESIVKRDTHVLFFDAINGNFVRHSKNGLISISDYGISEFSKELGKATIEDRIKLKGIYNERNELFYWLIDFTPYTVDPMLAPPQKAILEAKNAKWKALFEVGDNRLAIVFDDKANAWKGFVEMNSPTANAEMIGSVGSYMTAYVEGGVYIYDNDNFGSTLGVNRETHVEKIINVQPLKVKVFNYLEVNSDNEWLPSEVGDVKTENQESRIRMMRTKEGHYYSEFKRNCLYPNGTYRPNENQGEILRGNWCSVKLRLPTSTDGKQSTITSITAGATLSEKA